METDKRSVSWLITSCEVAAMTDLGLMEHGSRARTELTWQSDGVLQRCPPASPGRWSRWHLLAADTPHPEVGKSIIYTTSLFVTRPLPVWNPQLGTTATLRLLTRIEMMPLNFSSTRSQMILLLKYCTGSHCIMGKTKPNDTMFLVKWTSVFLKDRKISDLSL